MQSLDLGQLSITVEVDSSQADRDLNRVATTVDNLEREFNSLAAKKLNVRPEGERELQRAGESAKTLGRNLDGAAQSAKGVKTDGTLATDLQRAGTAAGQARAGMDNAAGAAGRLSGESRTAATATHDVARATHEVGRGAGSIGQATSAMGKLAGAARSLMPAISATALGGTILGKGWDRLTSIDNATFKLQGLGHTAESTASIMDAAMGAVKGTAYGFGEAASLAAGVVAATGAEGERLQQILTTVADVSAISGRSLGDIGLIFNQVAASGRLMGDDLNQLLGSSIPVITMLAAEMGVAQEEVKALASEGQISFEILESAMRNSLGGAAQEMGGSITGGISHVTAAFSRLGAEILSSPFNQLPNILSGATSTIDTLTDGMDAVNKIMQAIPGPVKEIALALTAGAVASRLFGTSITTGLTSIGASLATSAVNVRLWGENIAGAFRQGAAGAAGMDATMRGLASGGVAVLGSAFRGISGVAGGLFNLLGGPVGVALTGVSLAVGYFTKRAQENKQALQESEQRVQSWADTISQAGGKINDAVVSMSLDQVMDAIDEADIRRAGLSYSDLAGAVLDVGGSYDEVIATLDKLIGAQSKIDNVWSDEYRTAQETSRAAQNLKYELQELHGEYGAGVEKSREAAEGQRELSRALEDASVKAEGTRSPFTEANSYIAAMRNEAGEAKDSIEGLANAMLGLSDDPALRLQGALAKSMDEIRKFGETAQKHAGTAFAGMTESGDFDWQIEGASEMIGAIQQVSSTWQEAVASSVVMNQEAGKTLSEATEIALSDNQAMVDAFREQALAAGMTTDQVDTLIDRYFEVPETVVTEINAKGGKAVRELLHGINTDLAYINETDHSITVDADAMNVPLWKLKEMGYAVEELTDTNQIVLTAESDLARQAIEDVATLVDGITDSENSVVMRADTADLVDELAEIDGFVTRFVDQPHELPIFADTEEARSAIDQLGLDIVELPDGTIWVDSNSKEEIDKLIKLGAETAMLPSGHVEITDSTPHNIAALRDMGAQIQTLPDGRVIIKDNATQVRDTINTTLTSDLLNKTGQVTLNVIRHIKDVFTGGGGSKNGKALGGIAGYESGGRVLPRTGPGTDRIDGILGVGSDGIPVARVDRGEFITKRSATEKWEQLLWAINSDSPVDILAAAMAGVRGYAGGGVPGSTSGATKLAVNSAGAQAGTTVTSDTSGAAGPLANVAKLIAEIDGTTPTTVAKADTGEGVAALETLESLITGLPDGGSTVDVETEQARTEIDGLGDSLTELSERETAISATIDVEGVERSIREVEGTLEALGQREVTPTATVDTYGLEEGADHALARLDDIHAQNPVPEVDANTAGLDAGVAHSISELTMVGSAKATSVSDVDNTSALANIDAVIAELNKMPVERVIKIVAPGSVGGLSTGGTVPGLATGGTIAGSTLPTTGPGTDRVDGFLGIDAAGMPLVRVDAGEYVVNAQQTANYARELELINAGIFPKLDNIEMLAGGAARVPGLFRGGVVSPDQLLAFARGNTVNGHTPPGSLEGSAYIWGGGLLQNWGDCSGAMSGLAAVAVGHNPQGRKFATMNQGPVLAAMGFYPGLGDPATSFNLGWFNGGPWGGHTSGTIGGVNVEMGGGRGNGQIGGAAAPASHPQYTNHAHIPLGEMVAFDHFAPIARVSSKRVPAGAGGYSPTGGRGLSYGGGNGLYLHDSGGWHMPGTLSFNGLSEPEAILTPRQWATLDKSVATQIRLAEATNGLTTVLAQHFPEMHDALIRAVDTAEYTGELIERAVANPEGLEAEALRGAADRTVKLTDLLGLEEGTVVLGGLIDAEKELTDARRGQMERTANLAQSEKNLEEAQKRLADLQSGKTEMDVKDQRKLADAEEALAKARKGGKADKIVDAEQKLARVKEDLAEDQVKAEEKRAEDIVKATDDVAKAEKDLAEARRESARGLDMDLYEVAPDIHHGLLGAVSQINSLAAQAVAMGGQAAMAAGPLASLAGGVGSLATMVGPAGMSVGMAIQIATTVIQVVKLIGDTIKDWVEHGRNVRAAQSQLIADALRGQAEYADALFAQRQAIAGMLTQIQSMQIEVAEAAWEAQKAQAGVWDAHLKGLVGVAEAEAKLREERSRLAGVSVRDIRGLAVLYGEYIDQIITGLESITDAHGEVHELSLSHLVELAAGREAENDAHAEAIAERLRLQHNLSNEEQQVLKRVFAGRFAGLDAELATIEDAKDFAEAYYLLQRIGMSKVLEQATRTSVEMLALQTEVRIAELQRMVSVRTATLESIQAAQAHENAVRKLKWATEDLERAQNRLRGLEDVGGTGKSAEIATIEAKLAELYVLQSQYQADANNWWYKIVAATDASFNGLKKETIRLRTAEAALPGLREEIAKYESLLAQHGGSQDTRTAAERRNDEWLFALAAQVRASGDDAAADQIIRGTMYGQAQVGLDYLAIQDRLAGYEDERLQIGRDREQVGSDAEYYARTSALDQEIYELARRKEALEYLAAGLRAEDILLAQANYAVADHMLGAADTVAHMNTMGAGAQVQAAHAQVVRADRSQAPVILNVNLVEEGIVTSEQIVGGITGLENDQREIKTRVNLIDRLLSPSARAVQLSRAGRS